MTEEKENCNFQQDYNVYGLDDKPCCYLYHKYCDDIENCYFKRYKRLEQENERMRYKIQEVVQANDRIIAECAEIMKPKCETSIMSELMKENNKFRKALEEIREIVIGNYEVLEPQAKKDIEKLINEVLGDEL